MTRLSDHTAARPVTNGCGKDTDLSLDIFLIKSSHSTLSSRILGPLRRQQVDRLFPCAEAGGSSMKIHDLTVAMSLVARLAPAFACSFASLEARGEELSKDRLAASAADFCDDTTFIDEEGNEAAGTRRCGPDLRDLKPEQVRLGVEIGGIKGELGDIRAEKGLIAENIKAAIEIAGIVGTLTSPPPCEREGDVGCYVRDPFKATEVAALRAKVVEGQTVIGIEGAVTLPRVGQVLSGVEYGLDGSERVGTLLLPNVGNVLAGSPPYGDAEALSVPSYSPDFPERGNVKSTATVNGLAGTLMDCGSDGATDCVATPAFKAADITLALPGNIRAGITIAGQLGEYPSATYPLPSASGTLDLEEAGFSTAIKTAASFEYWTSDGVRQTGSGSSSIVPENILAGVSIFGEGGTLPVYPCTYASQAACSADSACLWTGGACTIDPFNLRRDIVVGSQTGSLKLNCRNHGNTAVFNLNSGIQWWETINNHNNGLSTLPDEKPAGWDAGHLCGKELWADATADGACDSAADDCMMKDRVSGLIWTESYPVASAAAAATMLDWSQSVAHCDGLSYGGRSDWRLPTQMELVMAYQHGIRQLAYKGAGTIRPSGDTLDNNDAFIPSGNVFTWTASARSTSLTTAEYVSLGEGRSSSLAKSTNNQNTVLCVAP
jgi:hypothetical protein